MNVLRSLARELFNLYGTDSAQRKGEAGLRSALDKRIVPPVVDLSRYRDSFEQLPQGSAALKTLKGERAFVKSSWAALGLSSFDARPSAAEPRTQAHFHDGFEAGRRRPVDLSGGVKPTPVTLAPEAPAPAPALTNGFAASLDDLL